MTSGIDHRDPVVLFSTSWNTHVRTEMGAFVRQVAGSLAATADVVVFTLESGPHTRFVDGAFSVHPLDAHDRSEVLHRELISSALSSTNRHAARQHDEPAQHPTIGADRKGASADSWRRANRLLHELNPSLVLISGLSDSGMIAALDASAPDTPVVLLPTVVNRGSLALPSSTALLDRAQAVLVASEPERVEVAQVLPQDRRPIVRNVGYVVPTAAIAQREPVTALAGQSYVVVHDEHRLFGLDREQRHARFLTCAFPETPIVVVNESGVELWLAGNGETLTATVGSADLDRLLAWALLTVDATPGPLVSSLSIRSLRNGTPIVVPEGSRAHYHAEIGGGGLWYRDLAELREAVREMKAGPHRERFGTEGRVYADTAYGRPRRFLDQVRSAIGACSDGAR